MFALERRDFVAETFGGIWSHSIHTFVQHGDDLSMLWQDLGVDKYIGIQRQNDASYFISRFW